MHWLFLLAGALGLLLASLAAVNATERAASRISGPWGWGLARVWSVTAAWLLRRNLGGVQAVAVAVSGLMFTLPVVATWAGWRRRR